MTPPPTDITIYEQPNRWRSGRDARRDDGAAERWIDGSQHIPPLWELLALGACFVGFLTAYLLSAFVFVRIGIPLALIAILGAAAGLAARRDSAFLWTPLFGFRLGNVVFTGFGSLIPYIVDENQLARIYTLYNFNDAEAAKLLVLWLMYIAAVMISVRVTALVVPRVSQRQIGAKVAWLNAGSLGLSFFGAGLAYAVLIDLGFALGLHALVLPGAVSTVFQAVNAVGIFLLVLVAFERGGGWYALAIFTLLVSVALGLVVYNKSMILFPILLVSLAVLIRKVTAIRVIGATAALFFALSILQPAIEHARNEHTRMFGVESGTSGGGSIAERTANVVSYWTVGPVNEEDLGSGITRLSYLNIGTYLVAQYDLGIGGDTMSSAAIALIPRFIWPEKPILTDVGSALNEQIFGSASSFIAPSAVGDIYWNFGWWGLVVLAIPIGIAIWLGTVVASGIITRQDWFMMPFVLLAFRTALQTEQGFVVGMLVPTVFAYLLLIALRLTKELLAMPSRA